MNADKTVKPILLAGTEEVTRKSIQARLAATGYKVAAAEDGQQVIDALSGQEFSLLILDLNQPQNIINVLREVKKRQPRLKSIVITGNPAVETAVEAIKAGASEYLTKPYDIGQLEKIVSTIISQGQAEGKPAEITLWINDKMVKAAPGTTILQAAQSAGIEIPTLCYHENLTPYGGCRLCTVEIIRNNRSRLVTACVYTVEEGLKVLTESEPVVKIRRMLLEMMWSRAPGVQALRDYGIKYGINKDRFDVEPTYCILCGLCVRYCREVKKKNIIGFTGRGTEREVMFLPEADFNECLACGECYKLCPTGVMPSNYGLAKLPK